MALRAIEAEIAQFNKLPIPNSSTSDGVTRDLYERRSSNLQRKVEDSIVRSNDHVVVVQAAAKAHVSLLLSETLLRKFHGQMQTLMLELAKEHQASSQGVTERIMVFSEREPMFLQLLKECDDVIAEEITRKLVCQMADTSETQNAANPAITAPTPPESHRNHQYTRTQ